MVEPKNIPLPPHIKSVNASQHNLLGIRYGGGAAVNEDIRRACTRIERQRLRHRAHHVAKGS